MAHRRACRLAEAGTLRRGEGILPCLGNQTVSLVLATLQLASEMAAGCGELADLRRHSDCVFVRGKALRFGAGSGRHFGCQLALDIRHVPGAFRRSRRSGRPQAPVLHLQ
ncbi:hypothetical protein MTBUT4_310022 [Magnetospirillum sp. UT-4]|nr:hypothetical protein MTBUT4_310022 [Magnetospirillum sp. UT-4]